MKKSFRQRLPLVFMALCAFAIVLSSPVAYAAGETAYLTPSSGTVQAGNRFTVSVDGRVGQSWWLWIPIGASSVEGSLSFPIQHLKVVSVDPAGSAFPNGSITPNNSTGKIDFNNSSSGSYMNKNVHLFSITFQAVSAGSANITFGNVKYNIGSAATTGGNYTVTAAPPAPTPTPTPSPSPTPSPTPKPSQIPISTPRPSVAPVILPELSVEETPAPINESDGSIKISDVIVTANRQRNSVSWEVSDANATPTLMYGTSKSTIKSQAEATKQSDGSYQTVFKDLKLGTLYYFSIKVAATDNLRGGTYTDSFTTKGYPVQLTIQQNGLLLPGAKVTINERTFTANKEAVIITELGDGRHTATITPAGSSTPVTVEFSVEKKKIPTSGNPATQNIIVNAKTLGSTGESDKSSSQAIVIASIVAGVILLTGIVGFIIFRRRSAANTFSQQIDADLLSSSYGPAINTTANAPMPNLETVSVLPPEPSQYASTTDTQVLSDQTGPLSMQNNDTNNVYDTIPEQQFSSLPLPPVDDALSDNTAVAQGVVDENQQLTQQLAQVESSEETVLDEPSAVYDETTGELDIIHHSHHSEQINNLSTVPSPSLQDQAINSDTTEKPVYTPAQTYDTNAGESPTPPETYTNYQEPAVLPPIVNERGAATS